MIGGGYAKGGHRRRARYVHYGGRKVQGMVSDRSLVANAPGIEYFHAHELGRRTALSHIRRSCLEYVSHAQDCYCAGARHVHGRVLLIHRVAACLGLHVESAVAGEHRSCVCSPLFFNNAMPVTELATAEDDTLEGSEDSKSTRFTRFPRRNSYCT